MEIEAKEVLKIEDGSHEGAITRVEYRTEPYDYTDVFVSINAAGFELKTGYPTHITEESKLGLLLARFGCSIIPGKKYDPTNMLVGKKVEFLTMTETKDGKAFIRIIPESLKPAKTGGEGVEKDAKVQES
jgi:hypothetical protein